MKTSSLIFIFLIIYTFTFAQSNSFQALKDKFSDTEEVNCFSANGFLARLVLRLAGERDFTKAIKEIKSVKFITIPVYAFEAKKVSINGFKKILLQDSFEELATIRDHGDDVTVFLQSTKTKNHRYMMLVEEPDEIVVIELDGYINPNMLIQREFLAFDKL